LIVATAALIMFAVAQFIQSPDPVMLYLFAVLCFILLISAACWIFTSRLYLPGLGLNLLMLPVAFGLLILFARFARVLDISNDWAELVTYAVYDSLLAASCGFWIVKSNPSKSGLLTN